MSTKKLIFLMWGLPIILLFFSICIFLSVLFTSDTGIQESVKMDLVTESKVSTESAISDVIVSKEDFCKESLASALVKPLDSSKFSLIDVLKVAESKMDKIPERLYPKMQAIPDCTAFASNDLIKEGSLVYIQGAGVYQVQALKEHSDFVYIISDKENYYSAPIYILK